MTEQQAKTIEHIRESVLRRRYGHTQASYEIKQFEISTLPDCDLVFLVVETGLKGDEGTMASVLCRDHRHIKIGVRGGCELLNSTSPRTQSKGIFNVLNNLTKY